MSRMSELDAAIETRNKTHQEFLSLARDLGVTIVGIGDTRHELLGNELFPFHHRHQIFTPPDHEIDGGDDYFGTAPAAWVLARRAGIHGGCGNSGQCQADTTGLEPGVWILLAGGEWGRVK